MEEQQSKQPHNKSAIIITILITALVVGGGVFALQELKIQSLKNSQALEIRTAISDVKIEITDNLKKKEMEERMTAKNDSIPINVLVSYIINEWEIYENSQYGYKLNVPSDWEISENINGTSRTQINTPDWIMHPYAQEVSVSVREQTLEEYIEAYNNSDVLDDGTQLSRIVEQKNTILNGLEAIFLRGTTGLGIDSLDYFISHNGLAYIIGYADTSRNVNIGEIIRSFEIVE